MPTVWLRFRSALVVALFFPWFPVLPLAPPEAQLPALAVEAGAADEPRPAAPAPEEPVVLPGVVIEEIPKGSALEKAGLQVGDVILSWERLANPPANPAAAEGVLTSYFDWLELEVEQVPRGEVVLRGRRGGEPLELRVEPGDWAITVRPVLARVLEEMYLAGKAKLTSGDIEAAVQAWRSLTDGSGAQGVGDLRAWVALRIGDSWGEKGEWGKAVEAYGEARAATETPSAQVASWEAVGKAHERRNEYAAAEEAYTFAEKIRQKAHPQSLGVARSVNDLGEVAYARGDLARAHESFVQALQIRKHLASQSLDMAASLNNLGAVAQARGELDLSYDYHLRALRIREQFAPESLNVAASLNNLGIVAWTRGLLDLAYAYHLQALSIRERLAPKSLDVAASLNNLGNVFLSRGELGRAHDYYLQALRLKERLAPQSLSLASSLNNLGSVLADRGDLDRAEQYQLQALRIQEQIAPHSLVLATSLRNLGIMACIRGDLERARGYLFRALQAQEQLAPKSLEVAETLDNLGTVSLVSGELERAYDYHRRALEIEEDLAPESLRLAVSLSSLGLVSQSRGKLDEARNYLLRALQIQAQLAPQSLEVAKNLNNLGSVSESRRELDSADNYYRRALEIIEQLAPQSYVLAACLTNIGAVARTRGDMDDARDYYLRALEALELQLSRLGGSYTVQAGFRAQYRGYYQDMLDLFLTQGRPADALYVLERFRAQTFLTMLAERDTAFTADISEDLDRERRRLGVLYDRTMKKLAGLNLRDNAGEIEATRRELQKLNDEAGDIEARIRQASPRLAALQFPHPLAEAEAQQALDSGTLLLAYSVGKEKTALFALSRSGDLEVKILPLGEEALRSQVKATAQPDPRGGARLVAGRFAPAATAGRQPGALSESPRASAC